MAERGNRSEERFQCYKTTGVDLESLRKEARDATVQLRKERRSQQFLMKRDVTENVSSTITQPSAIKLSEAQNAILAVMSENRDEVLKGIRQLCKLTGRLRTDTEATHQMIHRDVIERLVTFLGRMDDSELQFEATCFIAHIVVSSPEKHTRVVVECKAVPALIQLFSSSPRIQRYALLALGNIAADYEDCRNCVLEANILHPLLQLLHTSNDQSVVMDGLFCLSQLHQGPLKSGPNVYTLLFDLLMRHDEERVFVKICSTLVRFFQTNEYPQLNIRQDLPQRLVTLLQQESILVVKSVLLVLDQILKGDPTKVDMFLECSLLSCLRELLRASDRLHKEICSVIARIAGCKHHVQAVIDAGICLLLVDILSKGKFNSKTEAAFVLQAATAAGSTKQTQTIVQLGYMEPLFDMLNSKDLGMLLTVLCTLISILKAGALDTHGGPNVYAEEVERRHCLDRIKSLQYHEQELISKIATSIISLYFQSNDCYGKPNVIWLKMFCN